MPAPAVRVWLDMEVVSATNLRNAVNGPINYLIGRDLGSDDTIELEESLEILSGADGNRYLRIPQGTTGQRPTRQPGVIRFNTSDDVLDIGGNTAWLQALTSESITFANLDANGDVGGGDDQVAQGSHTHLLSLLGSGTIDVTVKKDTYIVDENLDGLFIYDEESETWGTEIPMPAGATSPTGCAVLPTGQILVSENNNDRLLLYNPVSNVWTNGPDYDSITNVAGVGADADGNYYVAGDGNDVQKYDVSSSSWDAVVAIAGLTGIEGFTVAPNGDWLLLDTFPNPDRFYRYSNGALDTGIELANGIVNPRGLALTADGNVRVVTRSANRIWEYSYVTQQWTNLMATPGNTNAIVGMAIGGPTTNATLISGTTPDSGVLNIEVLSAARGAQASVTVEVDGATETADTTITSDNEDARIESYRVDVDSGDDYEVSVTANSDGAVAAVAFLNRGARTS